MIFVPKSLAMSNAMSKFFRQGLNQAFEGVMSRLEFLIRAPRAPFGCPQAATIRHTLIS